MEERRAASAAVCIFESIWVASTILVVYMALVFENIPGMDYWTSLKIFGWGCGITATVSILFNMSEEGFLPKIFNITLPLGIYTVITYYSFAKKSFAVLGLVALAIAAIYGFLIFSQRIKNKRKKTKIIVKRILKFLGGVGFIANLLMAFIVCGMCAKILTTGFAFSSPAESVKSFEEAHWYSVGNHIEKLCVLTNDEWQTLSVREKLDVLQIIVNIETDKLGCDTNIRIGAGAQRENVLGSYNNKKKIITVDRDFLEEADPEEILGTVTHECRHAYQERLVEAYDGMDEIYKNLQVFEDARKFKEGFLKYRQSEYYTNPIEVDARSYSEEAAMGYLMLIYMEDSKRKPEE